MATAPPPTKGPAFIGSGRGTELVEGIRRHRSVPVVFMSGHPKGVVAHQGLVPSDVPRVETPFNLEGLLRAVRDALQPR